MLMLPIHLAIGLVVGATTAAFVLFIRRARPELVDRASPSPRTSLRPVLLSLLALAALTGGALSWLASPQPDGLEWSIEKTAGSAELPAPEHGVHDRLAALQARLALLPDYALPSAASDRASVQAVSAHPAGSRSTAADGSLVEASTERDRSAAAAHGGEPAAWPAVDAGRSLAGLVGGALTLALVWLAALLLRRRRA
jgi:cobalt/nickel transport system permease protein